MNNMQDYPQTPVCACCGDSEVTPNNPLIKLVDKFNDDALVHLRCAQTDDQFDFCRYCGSSVAYLAEHINQHGECPDHKGESAPDYPEEDRESYIEYIQNH